MDRKDKIKEALYRRFTKGSKLKTREVIDCVRHYYPEIPIGSILPSDFCCNYKNNDPFSGRYYIFNKLGRGYYELL